MSRTDLAEFVMDTCYVPTLGPSHPDERRPELWQAVLDSNGTGAFLDFDKNRVWGEAKQETILIDHIASADDVALVPVLNRRGLGAVEVYCFGDLDQVKTTGADLAAKLAADYGIDRAQLKWCTTSGTDEDAHRSVRIQLKTFEPSAVSRPLSENIKPLTDQPTVTRASFEEFAADAGDGFPFVASRLTEGIDDGPILTAVEQARVVGAIGPMRLMPDSLGRPRLLPQYFAVVTAHRGRGYGRVLWNAAMAWGADHGAAYQLLQTEVGGASDRLCQTDGLTALGILNTQNISL